MRYKVGDKVQVRRNLSTGKLYYSEDKSYHEPFTRSMKKYAGMEAEIIEVSSRSYKLDIDPIHSYTDEMLQLPVDELAVAPYELNEEVEALLHHVMKQLPEQMINDAIDKGDKERFIELSKKFFSNTCEG